jgi:sulfide:quinone oxidoreductase
MANILIVGGGFGGVVAAESLSRLLSEDHQITLVSRSKLFVFYPALVRLAFGECSVEDVSFDLRHAMLNRRVRFIEAEAARLDPDSQRVITAHGDVEGNIPYDFLILAPGRRLATERITGFFEHAHHLLNVDATLEFSGAIGKFKEGRAIIGQCYGSRLSVPVYETAFALSRALGQRGETNRVRISIASPDPPGYQFGDALVADALRSAFQSHDIEFLSDFPINKVTSTTVSTSNGHTLNYNLLMLLPPFRGPGIARGLEMTDDDGYINVDKALRVENANRIYAAGDCVNFVGPKMGHMAVHQAEVAAANVALEIQGREPLPNYNHELMMVIDEVGAETIYLHKELWGDEPSSVRQGRFWSWAKHVHEKYWMRQHH